MSSDDDALAMASIGVELGKVEILLSFQKLRLMLDQHVV